VEGFLPIFFLAVVLKIPVLGALWLVWWASREPQADEFSEGSDDGPGRFRRQPLSPRGPRRGPHGGPHGGVVRRRTRDHPAELVSDRRERVPMDGCGSSSSRTHQAA
jgi:hypothetical protein